MFPLEKLGAPAQMPVQGEGTARDDGGWRVVELSWQKPPAHFFLCCLNCLTQISHPPLATGSCTCCALARERVTRVRSTLGRVGCCRGTGQESRVHCLTMLVSSPECMNSELLEELMSSEGESWSLPLTVWPFWGRKTVLCDITHLTVL